MLRSLNLANETDYTNLRKLKLIQLFEMISIAIGNFETQVIKYEIRTRTSPVQSLFWCRPITSLSFLQ